MKRCLKCGCDVEYVKEYNLFYCYVCNAFLKADEVRED